MEIWDIYNEEGNQTGRTAVRGETLAPGEYHLVVHIWITNDDNAYLIQKRADHLQHLPGVWAATGGSAIAGEESKAAAMREVKEELGFEPDGSAMRLLARIKKRDHFTDVWSLHQNVRPEDIQLLEEEVSEARWISREALWEMIAEDRFHNYGADYFRLIWEERR